MLLAAGLGLAWWLVPRASTDHDAAVAAHTVERARGLPVPVAGGGARVDPSVGGTAALRLEGLVIDADELPVAGATVTVGAQPRRVVVTDEAGSFAVDGLDAGQHVVLARAGDAVGGPVAHRLTSGSEPVVLRLRPGAAVVVEVSAADGAALRSATVALRGPIERLEHGLDERSERVEDTGRATFRGVAPGRHVAVARAIGYAPAQRVIDVPDTPGGRARTQLVLRRGAPLAGQVVDDDGAPVAGARVEAEDAARSLAPTAPADTAETDDTGRFELPALAAGGYRLRVTHAAHAPTVSELITTDGISAVTGVRIVVRGGAVLRGRVVDAEGRGVVGARVSAAERGNGRAGPARPHQGTTNADGHFQIGGFAAGAYLVTAQAEAAASPPVAVDLRSDAGPEVVLTLEPTGAISGNVVDGAGQPAAETQVIARRRFDVRSPIERPAAQAVHETTTDGGGAFVLADLPAGAYELRATRRGGSPTTFAVPAVRAEPGDRDVQLTLPGDGAITGRLRLDTGGVPATFSVALAGTPSAAPPVDEQGRFTISPVPAGRHRLRLRGPFVERTLHDIEVQDGQTTDLGTISLDVGRVVSGRVTAGGAPVVGAEVIVGTGFPGDGFSAVADFGSAVHDVLGLRRVRSGADGRFRLTGIDDGAKIVLAESPAGRSRAQTIGPGQQEVTVHLALRAYGSVLGRVVSESGEPVAGTVVVAAEAQPTGHSLSVGTGPDGRFYFARLPAGEWVLRIDAMRGGDGEGHHVRVRPGEQTTIDLTRDRR